MVEPRVRTSVVHPGNRDYLKAKLAWRHHPSRYLVWQQTAVDAEDPWLIQGANGPRLTRHRARPVCQLIQENDTPTVDSGVRRFLDEQVASARELGYVETLLGRRRYIPELQSSNGNIRQFGERIAQNTPIQGTAADLLKKAMIEVDRTLEGSSWGARLLLTVHDELLFEVPEERVDEVRPVVVALMEGAVELSVPVAVDWGVGTSWYEAKG